MGACGTVRSMRFGYVALVAGMLTTACTTEISLSAKTRDVQDNVLKADVLDWSGGKIRIQNDGVGVSINGGVKVVADASATKVSATARFVALVLPEEKTNGDLSINDAVETFSITRSGDDVIVNCNHGQTHGSSAAGDSGCELLTVTIPTGTATTPLDLSVLSGNGEVNLALSSAVLVDLATSSNVGNTVAVLPATKSATIALVSEQAGDLDVTMPAGWSADSVVLGADADEIANSFALTSTGGYGAPGAGLASLTITSKPFAGSTGKITLH